MTKRRRHMTRNEAIMTAHDRRSPFSPVSSHFRYAGHDADRYIVISDMFDVFEVRCLALKFRGCVAEVGRDSKAYFKM